MRSSQTELFPQCHGNFEEQRKLAAVSREAPEITRNSQSQNTLDPEMAPEYILMFLKRIKGE